MKWTPLPLTGIALSFLLVFVKWSVEGKGEAYLHFGPRTKDESRLHCAPRTDRLITNSPLALKQLLRGRLGVAVNSRLQSETDSGEEGGDGEAGQKRKKDSAGRMSTATNKTSAATVIINDDIIKSDQDKCKYRQLKLPNGLEALLISEEGLDKASAALDVNVGNFYDPKEYPGLAHFLEHLLFMGTEKYPDENDYGEYLSSHGGYSNAFTAEEHTNYFFDVNAEYFEGALDRFAQFFIAPLFSPAGTLRELQAVDSEHKKNVRNDHWRLNQLEKTLSNPHHPYSNFGTGNAVTLGGEETRDVLLDFYDKHYSANIMKLVVYGKESLDELQRMVVEKFSAIRNKNMSLAIWPGTPLTTCEFGTLVRVKTIKELRSLYIVWQLPDLNKYKLDKPEHYFSHLLGHEGIGSVLSELKAQGWATGLGAGTENDSRGYAFFQLTVELSPAGLDHVHEIVKLIFQYLQMLKEAGPQEWVYRENQRLEEIAFRFMEKGSPSSFAYRTAGQMHSYPSELILKGPRVSLNYNEEALSMVLSNLRADNFRLLLATPQELSNSMTEKWYGTEYEIGDLPEMLLTFIRNPPLHGRLTLPSPNTFLPDRLDVKQEVSETPLRKPNLLFDKGRFRLWHKQDDAFAMPKGCVEIIIRSGAAVRTVENFVRTYLFIETLRDALTETSYEGEMAGLHFDIGQAVEGIYLSICGYDNKLPLFLDVILSRMVEYDDKVEEAKFLLVRDRYTRWLNSIVHDTPHTLSSYYWNGIQREWYWWYWEKAVSVEKIKHASQIRGFLREILSDFSVEALCHGNFAPSEALSIFDRVQAVLKEFLNSPSAATAEASNKAASSAHASSKNGDGIGLEDLRIEEEAGSSMFNSTIASTPTLSPSTFPRVLFYERGQNVILSPEPVNNSNCAIDFYLQIGSLEDVKLRTLTMLFDQIFREPFFDALRTKEQLGYIVRLMVKEKGPSIGLAFGIQSERPPSYLEDRIEKFLANVPTHLAGMTEAQFRANVHALTSKLLAKQRRMVDETSRYWAQIMERQYEFERVYTDAAFLESSVSLEDLCRFVEEHVLKGAPQRRKVSVHLWAQHFAADRAGYNRQQADVEGVKVFDDPIRLVHSVDRTFPSP